MIDVIVATCRTIAEVSPMVESITGCCRVIPTCLSASASINRNYGLKLAKSEIVIMLDDDIRGFYPGWIDDFIAPFSNGEPAVVSARLLNPNGQPGPCMGADNLPWGKGYVHAIPSSYKNYYRLPTAAIAFLNIPGKTPKFDEGFLGSGYEDTDWMNKMNIAFPRHSFLINNECKLQHLHWMTNQGGRFFEHNKEHYLSLWPDDLAVQGQTCWVPQGKGMER